jgi:hypothetical protein
MDCVVGFSTIRSLKQEVTVITFSEKKKKKKKERKKERKFLQPGQSVGRYSGIKINFAWS